jgi:hypothetical protein
MTPTRPRRIDWLLLVFMVAIGLAALSFACVIGAGVVHVGQLILAALWPFFVAHSDDLTLGLAIGISLGAVLALAMEGRR